MKELVKNNYSELNNLRNNINEGDICSRVKNMEAMANNQKDIKICSGKKTFEYQICLANVSADKNDTKETWLYELIKKVNASGIELVDAYMEKLGDGHMSEEEQQNVALLMWKCLPGKAGFAQELNLFLLDKIENEDTRKFNVPSYIEEAINHLIP